MTEFLSLQMAFGTGTYWEKDNPDDSYDNLMVEFLILAIERGYRHFDCADFYGTEREVGIAIRRSGLPRGGFYITVKVRDGMDNIEASLDASLQKFGVEKVDM